jgi:pimeloyl-ACP methyl ester carboxylesterase
MLSNASLYRSPQGYAAMMDTYDRQLACWPVPFQEQMLDTRYGETHVIACGDEDAPPLVLVHGLAASALVWRPNIAVLSQHFRTYALDNIGDAGKSAPTRPPLHNAAYGEWLVDVLDALHIDHASIMGISLGGWMTLKLAIHAPERVSSAIVLCPAGFVPPRLTFVPKALALFFFPQPPVIDDLARTLCSPEKSLPPEDRELLDLSMRYHRGKAVPVLPLSDAELGSITARVLLLVGQYDVIYPSDWMVERARHCIPNLYAAEIIPDAGHSLSTDQTDLLHEKVLAFLAA